MKYNPEAVKAANNKYRQAHPDEIKAYTAGYYQAHREESAAHTAKYRQEHPEKISAHQKRYRQKHHEQLKVAKARYYQAHKEEGRARHATKLKEWRAANPLKAREQVLRRQALMKGVTVGAVDFASILVRDKMCCGICGKKVRPTDMHFDHIIPLSQGGPHSEYNLQVSHATCNLRKGPGRLPSQTRLPL
jgi:5-methylcytosine-specific restriction endonuclease McrA